MKLFKLDIILDKYDSIPYSMTTEEISNIYNRKVITQINRNYNKLFLKNYKNYLTMITAL